MEKELVTPGRLLDALAAHLAPLEPVEVRVIQPPDGGPWAVSLICYVTIAHRTRIVGFGLAELAEADDGWRGLVRRRIGGLMVEFGCALQPKTLF